MTPAQHEKLTKIRHDLLDACERKDYIDVGFCINDLDTFLYNSQPDRKIKKEATLIAINECIMDNDCKWNPGEKALIIGKEYKVEDSDDDEFQITSEIGSHFFPHKEVLDFFTIKP